MRLTRCACRESFAMTPSTAFALVPCSAARIARPPMADGSRGGPVHHDATGAAEVPPRRCNQGDPNACERRESPSIRASGASANTPVTNAPATAATSTSACDYYRSGGGAAQPTTADRARVRKRHPLNGAVSQEPKILLQCAHADFLAARCAPLAK